MNDFTKDELEQLYHCAKFVTEYNWLHDRYEGLMKKIQSMIDNYCEHIPILELNWKGEDIFICNKCGKTV